MDIADQFSLALEFMLLGMGVVFTFLAFLVLVVKWTGHIVQKIECSGAAGVASQTIHSTRAGAVEDETLTAVITAAVHQYRRQFARDRT